MTITTIKNKKRPRMVTFSTLEMIEFSYCLGDNPSASGGPPISMSWDCHQRTMMDIDVYEEYRPKRRNKGAFHLSKTTRTNLLLENGHTETEIVSAAIAAAKTRKERIDTIHEIKQKYKALVAAGIFEKVNDIDQKQQPPQQKQQYVSSTLSPIPTMNRSTGLTPSPIISRKRSPMRLIVSGPSPSTMTTTQLAQLRLPSSPEDQQQQHRGGRGGGGSSSSFISPRCQIQRKRSAPTMMMDTVGIDDIFGYSSDAAAIRSDPFSYTPARVCTPKYDVCSSPRSLLVSSSSITSSSTVMMMRTPPPAAGGGGRGESSSLSSSPVGKEKRPPIQPRRLASTPPPPKVAALYQQSFAPSRSM